MNNQGNTTSSSLSIKLKRNLTLKKSKNRRDCDEIFLIIFFSLLHFKVYQFKTELNILFTFVLFCFTIFCTHFSPYVVKLITGSLFVFGGGVFSPPASKKES